MATLLATHPTLLDYTRMLDPKGKIDRTVEIIAETNDVHAEMVWQEGNNTLGHRTTVLAGLPSGTWRKLYGGVTPTRGERIQVNETVGFLEAFAEADAKLAELGNNLMGFRKNLARDHIVGLNQDFASALFTADEAVNPERFTGFGPRFNSLSANNAENILVQTTGSHSMYLVGWGPMTVFGIFPSGSIGGLQRTDYGKGVFEVIDANGTPAGRMVGYREHFSWDCGLCVADWRYVVRIQYDQSTLTKDASAGDDLVDIMTEAIELLPDGGDIRPAFYMNRTARSFLRRQIKNSNNVRISMDQVAGRRTTMFDDIPCRRVDVLATADAATIT